MMRRIRLDVRHVFLSALLLGGCVQPHASAPASPVAPVMTPAAAPAKSCRVLQSREWTAWVNAMPGPGARPTLIVIGKVTVPTGGYRFTWGEPIVMQSYPVQVSVELQPVRPTGMVTQALVEREVRGEWPMSDPVGAVTITCGSKTLARISPVQTAS